MTNSLEHYFEVKKNVDGKAELICVTKKHSVEQIQLLYDQGERCFGENHALELIDKANALPKDIEWQFIGHLQRNKVKSVLPYISRIQSLDNIELAKVIEKECTKAEKNISCLIEVHLALDDTNKTGLAKEDVASFVKEVINYPHIRIEGLMCMGPHTADEQEIRRVFTEASDLYKSLQEQFGTEYFHILSMGMSDDYQIALKCGSTMVRIGTYLFS